MTARTPTRPRGFYAIGVFHGKSVINIGTLWRSADILGAAYVFTVGRRYHKQASDVLKSWRHMPLFNFADMADLLNHLPHDTLTIGVEMLEDAVPLADFSHPERCVYLLGAEDHGLSAEAVARCHRTVVLPGERSMNVAVAGSIVMYDRGAKGCVGNGLAMQRTKVGAA